MSMGMRYREGGEPAPLGPVDPPRSADRLGGLLTDRAMPEIDGSQMAAAIKQDSPSPPIIMLTGFGDIMAVADEKPESADLVLGKPANIPDLRQAIVKVTAGVRAGEPALGGAN